MRLLVVSDIHGNISALERVADTAHTLIVLGDFLDYVDYHDPGAGILGAVFGPESVATFIAMRTAGDFHALARYNEQLWSTVADPVGTVRELACQRYLQVMAALSGRTVYLTLGNVDLAGLWTELAPPQLRYLDGQVMTIGGLRFGFVAGGARRHRQTRPVGELTPAQRAWQPLVREAAEYRAALAAVEAAGPVQVICTHIPPNLPGLAYDTIPARREMTAPGLRGFLVRQQPQLALSGHVHQPLWPRCRWQRTECVNVGHFQRTEAPYLLNL